MSDLSDLIPAFKRSVAVPGGFDELFPEMDDADIIGALMDAIAECQLDSLLSDYVVDPIMEAVTPDLSNDVAINAAGALVMVYAHYRVILNELRNRRNHVKYRAGNAEFEEDQTASMLNELLRQAKARKDEILLRAERGELYKGGAVVMDQAFIRSVTDYGSGVGYQAAWGG